MLDDNICPQTDRHENTCQSTQNNFCVSSLLNRCLQYHMCHDDTHTRTHARTRTLAEAQYQPHSLLFLKQSQTLSVFLFFLTVSEQNRGYVYVQQIYSMLGKTIQWNCTEHFCAATKINSTVVDFTCTFSKTSMFQQ